MTIRTRRTGPKTVEATFQLPINAAARTQVDSQVALLQNGVIPIVGADARRRPYVVGSAIALVHQGAKCLATAGHVMSDHQQEPLHIFAADRYTRPFGGTFQVDERHDLAAKLLSAEEIDWLGHVPFLPEGSMGPAAPTGERFYASVVGYPSSDARRLDRITIETRMESFSNWGVEDAEGAVEVSFNKKQGALSAAGRGQAKDQYGKSGGAIFGTALPNAFEMPTSAPTLVGVATRWRRSANQIRGASVRFSGIWDRRPIA